MKENNINLNDFIIDKWISCGFQEYEFIEDKNDKICIKEQKQKQEINNIFGE